MAVLKIIWKIFGKNKLKINGSLKKISWKINGSRSILKLEK
jgi:hypothetical protein